VVIEEVLPDVTRLEGDGKSEVLDVFQIVHEEEASEEFLWA
jgi:hypothetical protein